MFNFAGITHVITNPDGHAPGFNYSLVGSVPTSMLQARTPTTADVMAGRVQADGKAYTGRKWETVDQIILAAKAAGANGRILRGVPINAKCTPGTMAAGTAALFCGSWCICRRLRRSWRGFIVPCQGTRAYKRTS